MEKRIFLWISLLCFQGIMRKSAYTVIMRFLIPFWIFTVQREVCFANIRIFSNLLEAEHARISSKNGTICYKFVIEVQ